MTNIVSTFNVNNVIILEESICRLIDIVPLGESNTQSTSTNLGLSTKNVNYKMIHVAKEYLN